jgi:uncharacterized protein with von Willebrand factor type A (vWA) domain
MSDKTENINIHALRKIPEENLKKIWDSKFSNKPFPQVKAFILRDRDFNKLLEKLQKSKHIRDTQVREWGNLDPNVVSTAFMFPSEEGLMIIVRQTSPYPLNEDLEHELKHIHSGHHLKW